MLALPRHPSLRPETINLWCIIDVVSGTVSPGFWEAIVGDLELRLVVALLYHVWLDLRPGFVHLYSRVSRSTGPWIFPHARSRSPRAVRTCSLWVTMSFHVPATLPFGTMTQPWACVLPSSGTRHQLALEVIRHGPSATGLEEVTVPFALSIQTCSAVRRGLRRARGRAGWSSGGAGRVFTTSSWSKSASAVFLPSIVRALSSCSEAVWISRFNSWSN